MTNNISDTTNDIGDNSEQTLGQELIQDVKAHMMGFETDDYCRGYDRAIEQFSHWPNRIDAAIKEAYEKGLKDGQAGK